jgi:hypothetical protein
MMTTPRRRVERLQRQAPPEPAPVERMSREQKEAEVIKIINKRFWTKYGVYPQGGATLALLSIERYGPTAWLAYEL